MRALIISADDYEDSELKVPLDALRAAGVTTEVASPGGNNIRGKHGHKEKADAAVEDVDPGAFELLVLPGGRAPAKLRDNESVLRVVQAFFAAGKPVAAICHGPQILVSAGVMKGRTATSYHAIAGELQAAGAHYVDQPVVVDGALITSRKPADLPAFVNAILEQLGLRA